MANVTNNLDSSISLTTRSNSKVELTTDHFDAWFASIENDNSPETKALLATRLLGRFGLQSSKDVITFLRSPAGETIKKMLNDKLADMITLREQRQQAIRNEQSQHHRMLAFLLLGLAHKKEAIAHRLNDANLQQIEAKRHQTTNQPVNTDSHSSMEYLQNQANAFEESIQALEATLQDKKSELTIAKKGLIAIQQHEQDMIARHALFTDDLHQLLERLSPEHQTSEHITEKLQAIEQEINHQTDAITQHIVDGNDDGARQLALKTNSLHLQAGALKDMLSVLKGEKQLYDEDGIRTDSFKSAAFVLRPDLKVVKDSYGTQLLIGAHQTLNALSVEEKAHAQKKFAELKPEISSVKHSVQHNHQLEKQFHNQRVMTAHSRLTHLSDDITLIANSLAKAKATQASIMMEMKKSPPNLHKIAGMHASMPSPSRSSSTGKAPVCTLQTFNNAYKNMINHPSRQNINNFKMNLNQLYGQQGNDFQKMLGQIIPGRPIPPETMRFLERNIPNLTLTTINTPKPGYPSKKEASYTSPTPLSTKPSPY